MSKQSIKDDIIDKIRKEGSPGGNSAGKVATAMDAIVDAIPNASKGEGTSSENYVTEKVWSDRNKTLVKNGNNNNVKIIGANSSSLLLDVDQAVLQGQSEATMKSSGGISLEAGKTTLHISSDSDYVLFNQKKLATTDLASATQSGLMAIDHFKSVEDMITNFESLVQSQTEIKEALAKNNPSYWDTSVILTTVPQTKGEDIWLKSAFYFANGTNLESKTVYPDNTEIGMKGDIMKHNVPIGINEKENKVVAYNKNARTVLLSQPGGTLRIKRIVVSSETITRIAGNYVFFQDIDVSRAPNLESITSAYVMAKSLDFSENVNLKQITLAESPTLETVNIKNSYFLNSVAFYKSSLLKLSGITFPPTFRPTTMNIKETAFTYADIISMIADKWTGGESSSTLQVGQEMYDTIMAGDKTVFNLKNVDIVTI